jgi:hypothetical protein
MSPRLLSSFHSALASTIPEGAAAVYPLLAVKGGVVKRLKAAANRLVRNPAPALVPPL